MKINPSPYRTYPAKDSPWIYYQEWNQAIFLHWQVPKEILKPFIPVGLELDDFNSTYWVSLVAFTMNKVSSRFLPSIPSISDFHEVNLRTYVKENNKSGVFFLSIEGEKHLSNFIAKKLSGLPYEKATIARNEGNYHSVNSNCGNFIKTDFEIGKDLNQKDALDIWLTERYSLFLMKKGQKFIYEIDHEEWKIKQLDFKNLDLNYKIGSHSLSNIPDRCHYSSGVKVKAWSREKV